jgi:Flp pilus assembly protein TadG
MADRLRRLGGADEGLAALEVVIAGGVLVVSVLAVVQFALWFHARRALHAAAVIGAHSVAVDRQSEIRAEAAATDFLQASTGGLLLGSSASVTTRPADVDVVVQARLGSFVPGLRAIALRTEVIQHRELLGAAGP